MYPAQFYSNNHHFAALSEARAAEAAQSYYHHQQHLTALAEARAAEAAAKAAEAEYLAAEAARQEELALKARLYDLEQRKKFQRPAYKAPAARYPYDLSSAYQSAAPIYPQSCRGRAPCAPIVPTAAPVVAPQAPARSQVEKELEASLNAERAARIAAQEEVKRLAARQAAEKQYNPAQSPWPFDQPIPFSGATRKPAPSKPAQQSPWAKAAPCSKPSQQQSTNLSTEEFLKLLGASIGIPSIPVQAPSTASAPAQPAQPSSSKAAPSNASNGSLIEQLQARKGSDNLTAAGQIFEGFFVDAAPKPSPKQLATPSPNEALINQLLARYQAEQDDEVRDTIQATIDSLLSGGAPSPTPSSSSSSKGKERATPEPSSVSSGLKKVQDAETTFRKLETEFEFPTQLDFVTTPTTSALNDVPALSLLSFTARNHPVRYYEQNLIALLTDLDLVESLGNEELRKKRKEAVNLIEMALEALESEISGRWKSKVAKAEAVASESVRDSAPTQAAQSEPTVEKDVSRQGQEEKETLVAPVSDSTLSECEPNVLTSILNSIPESSAEEVEEEPIPISESTQAPVFVESTEDVEVESILDTISSETATAELEEEDSSYPSDSQVTIKPDEAESTLSVDTQASDISFLPKYPIESSPVSVTALSQHVGNIDTTVPAQTGLPPSPTTTDSSEVAFLLSDEPESNASKSKRSSKRKTQIEDLGSDWSDLDA